MKSIYTKGRSITSAQMIKSSIVNNSNASNQQGVQILWMKTINHVHLYNLVGLFSHHIYCAIKKNMTYSISNIVYVSIIVKGKIVTMTESRTEDNNINQGNIVTAYHINGHNINNSSKKSSYMLQYFGDYFTRWHIV